MNLSFYDRRPPAGAGDRRDHRVPRTARARAGHLATAAGCRCAIVAGIGVVLLTGLDGTIDPWGVVARSSRPRPGPVTSCSLVEWRRDCPASRADGREHREPGADRSGRTDHARPAQPRPGRCSGCCSPSACSRRLCPTRSTPSCCGGSRPGCTRSSPRSARSSRPCSVARAGRGVHRDRGARDPAGVRGGRYRASRPSAGRRNPISSGPPRGCPRTHGIRHLGYSAIQSCYLPVVGVTI